MTIRKDTPAGLAGDAAHVRAEPRPAERTVNHDGAPQLSRLGLAAADWLSLQSQGSVHAETRGERRYYKLFFRRAGRQRVRYIGDERQAAAIRGELAQLQENKRLGQRLNRLRRQANQLLRASKSALEPQLVARGFRYRGLAIHKSQRPRT